MTQNAGQWETLKYFRLCDITVPILKCILFNTRKHGIRLSVSQAFVI